MNSGSLIMAAYFASKALVEVGENVAPLSSHSTSFDCVGDLPDFVIPFIGDFIQELHQLSFNRKGFIGLGVSRLGRESKNVPEVPQRQGKFHQLGVIGF